MDNKVNNIDKEAIVTEIITLISKLEHCLTHCSLEDFFIQLYIIVGQFDRVSS